MLFQITLPRFERDIGFFLLRLSDLINIHGVVPSRLFVFNSSLKAVFYRAEFA